MTFRAKSRIPVYIPNRGDVIHTDFSPSAGSETALKHFAVVLTPKSFNERAGRALVCPITSKLRDHPFNVAFLPLPPHLPEKGQVLTDQIRSLDFGARGSSYAGHVDDATLRDIADVLFELVEGRE